MKTTAIPDNSTGLAVIDAVIDHLQKAGWTIESRSHADERGEDIVAVRSGQKLVVEAKGAGSSKSGTNRYGLPFSKGQVFDHVGKAVLKALRVVGRERTVAGIALPDNAYHRSEIGKVYEALNRLGVAVFWVTADKKVSAKPAPDEPD